MKPNNNTSETGTSAAIIGIGCFFPKSSGLKEYWRLLSRGQDAIDEVPESHWSPVDYYDKDPKKPDYVYCTRGGFLSPVSFDPSEFGIPPNSLEATDTSQLLGLAAAKAALEDAGYGEDREFNRDRVSVVLGVTGTQELVIPLGARLGHPLWRRALEDTGVSPEKTEEVIQRISDSYVSWQESSFPGLLGNVIAGRISNRLDLGGTNCAVDAACASSMSAIHLAMMEIETGRSDMVVTGGVDCLNDIFMHMCFSKTPILSPTGDVRPFSKDADGSILGEGIGILIFKRLEDAEKDGDRIYAVVKGVGTSSDGKSNSIYAPRAEGQMKALNTAYEKAGFSSDTVKLIEAHGTGTRVGDEVEFSALKQVFAVNSEQLSVNSKCALGSVKSMIGHTKAAAGAAGLIKAVLALYHKVLPPTIKADEPDPRLNIDSSPFYLNTQIRPWISEPEHPRRSGVSSFGFGGSNFHMVLEEYQKEKDHVSWDGSVEIIAVSGRTQEELKSKLEDLKADIEKGMPDEKISIKAAETRADFSPDAPFRMLLLMEKKLDKFENPSEIFASALNSLSSDRGENIWNIKNIFYGGPEKAGDLAFVFPGQGSQYVNMGRDFACHFPEFLEVLENADNAGEDSRISSFIYPRPAETPEDKEKQEKFLRSTDIAQPAIGAVSLGMAKILQRFGIKADAACGHSFGELTALNVSGKIDTESFFNLAFKRGRLMADAGRENAGTMMAVKAPLEDIDRLIQEENLDVILANRNSPDQGVLSGSMEGIALAEKACKQHNMISRRLPVSAAFHSRLMKDAQKPFAQAVEQVDIKNSDTLVFSNITAEPYPNEADKAGKLLGDQILSPVDFVNEIKNLFDLGVRTFVEVGPKSVLTGLIKAILKGLNFNAFSLDESSGKRFGIADLARLLCYLAACGHPVELQNWEHPVSEKRKQRMSVPICGANYRSESKKKKKPASKTPSKLAKQALNSNTGQTHSQKTVQMKSPAQIQKVSGTVSRKAVQKRKQQALPEKQQPVSVAIPCGAKPDKTIAGNITTMNKKNKSPFPGSVQGQGYFISDAFKAVQEGLKSMQSLHMQTAETHKKFLEAQTQASRTLQEMMESTQRLAEVSINGHSNFQPRQSVIQEKISPEQTAIPQKSAPKLAQLPQQTLKTEPQTVSPQIPAVSVPPVQEKAVSTPEPPVPSKPKASEAENLKEIDNTMLEVVSELTGYPVDMLSMDMDIEADLGIDSIKRVEILSAFEEKMPGLPQVSPEIMGTLKTLGEVVEHISGPTEKEAQASSVPSAPVQVSSSPKTGNSQAIETAMLEVVSELTGYPADMLSLDMDIEADLGIDSIKRVEILSAFEEKMPGLPQVSPEIMGTLKTLGQIVEYLTGSAEKDTVPSEPAKESPVQPSSEMPDTKKIESVMLEVVSNLTGYPADMLSLEMDIEADLGIDSIKRVEILSAFEEKMPNLPSVSPEVMGTLKTLGQIIDYLNQSHDSPKDYTPLENDMQKITPEQLTGGVKKKIISLTSKPLNTFISIKIPTGCPVFITQDSGGLGRLIAEEFQSHGIRTILEPPTLIKEKDILTEAGGLIIIADAWENQDEQFLKDAFALAHEAAPGLLKAGMQGGAVFGTITRMDGAFGFKGRGFDNAFQGGLAGLAKTASIEWESVCCHALDIDPSWTDITSAAKAAALELLSKGSVEAGLESSARIIPELVPSSYPAGNINLASGDVVVVSGGARGVTAAAALALAREIKPVLVLIGRSPLPSPEPEWLASLNDEGTMKKAILENEFTGRRPTPVQLEKAFQKYMAGREISDNLNSMLSTGSTVLYYPADVRDSKAVQTILNEVRESYGPVKALIHGAGTLEDRFIKDKTPEQFERVFDTKVKGFEVLLDALKKEPLNYLILFSSIAARMGNKGQADYAMANEVLNKMAQQESLLRPECRVISFNWGPWDGGMVSPALKREFTRSNIELIPLEEGALCMLAEMTGEKNSPVEVVIGSGLGNAEAEASPPLKEAPKPSHLSVSFKREMDLERFPILESHILDGKPVVPFALMAEWLGYGALHENPGLFLRGLDDIRLLKGIRLEDAPKMIHILSSKAKRSGDFYEVDVELRNGAKSGNGMIHSRAKAILSDMPHQDSPVFRPPADIRMKSYPKSIEEVYENILFHGVELRGIKEIMTCSPQGMVAKIAPAPPPEKWMAEPLRSQWISDPLVLDCAFQMAIVWCYENRGLLSLPSYGAEYRQYQSQFPVNGVTAILEVEESTRHKMKGDFIFLDSSDKVTARLNGYEAVMDESLFKAFKQ